MPLPRPGCEWKYDPGAIPGEPEDYLCRHDREVAVIVEEDIDSERVHRVVLANGEEVGRDLTFEEARELAERVLDWPDQGGARE